MVVFGRFLAFKEIVLRGLHANFDCVFIVLASSQFNEPFSEDMQALHIFGSWSSRVQIMILTTYMGSLQKIDSKS
jgi:hypothetical protein